MQDWNWKLASDYSFPCKQSRMSKTTIQDEAYTISYVYPPDVHAVWDPSDRTGGGI